MPEYVRMLWPMEVELKMPVAAAVTGEDSFPDPGIGWTIVSRKQTLQQMMLVPRTLNTKLFSSEFVHFRISELCDRILRESAVNDRI
jgi:hypothetical protein